MISTELITAIAAMLAAILSAATLVSASRQEERRYRREALVETLMQVVNASFGGIGNAAYRARKAGKPMISHKVKALLAHDAELDARSRLRLLASKAVVRRVSTLHDIEDEMWDRIFKDEELIDENAWKKLRDHQRYALNALFTAARQNLNLGDAGEITDSPARGGPTDEDREEVEAYLRSEPGS